MKDEIILEIKNNLKDFDKLQSKYKLNSDDAVKLLCGTVATESEFIYKRQRIKKDNKIVEEGEGCSFFQIESATAIDILHNYVRYPTAKGIMYRRELEFILNQISNVRLNNINKTIIQNELLNNFVFATFIARLCYYRQSFSFNKHTVEEYAYIWKRYYNTANGAGTEKKFIDNYKRFELDKIL